VVTEAGVDLAVAPVVFQSARPCSMFPGCGHGGDGWALDPATLPVSATSGTSCVRELVSRVEQRARRVASSMVERSPAPAAHLLHLKLKNDYHM